MPQKVDTGQIRRAVHNSIPLTIKSYTLPRDTEDYIDEILKYYLAEIGHEKIFNPMSYCIKELTVNAKKANTKRVYFKERSLDINDETDYDEGMKTFKDDTLSNIDFYLKKQKAEELFIKVVFRTSGNQLVVSVRNNVELTRKEHMRAYDRIARSRAFETIEEAFSAVLDSTEGAGLGIVMMVLMLRKIGLTEDAFELDVSDGETIARITIPFSEIHLEKMEMLTKAVVNEVDSLPQFPENLVYLQQLIVDPEADIHEIARQISTDPSLTADLLKLVNSAMYMLPKKIDSIVEAVKLVGMRGLRNLLYTYGSQKIFEKKYAEMRELWQHAYRVAFYAYSLARTFRRKNDVVDDVFVGGILHELGKIVANSLHPELVDKVTMFCRAKDIPEKLLEDMAIGLNYPEIGSMIAGKWNFPDQLIAAIRWHREPLECDPQFTDIVYIVYLAKSICLIEKGELEADHIEPQVMKHFGIGSQEQLQKIIDRIQKSFKEDRLPES